ncbi:unnamed protein product [Clavelina lepadiformis]|uniref:Phosphatidic acid phosphatase type 2/haloperoxidase domain-containing protein n=1 Tax=Clavelina lepadiformis TaxID=159417 RepID=A0ABP0FBX2_CLALP
MIPHRSNPLANPLRLYLVNTNLRKTGSSDIHLWKYTEEQKAFERIIQPEEWWLYKNPISTAQRITTFKLFAIVLCVPLLTIMVFSGIFRGSQNDIFPALLCSSFAIILNGNITNCIKLMVGRPRPDFFFRCFPNGEPPSDQPSTFDLKCTGDVDLIIEGRKSFPSGHSSFSFVSLGFCALYMAGKLQCFNSYGRERSWRFCVCLTPLIVALIIAIGRTCDYRHHWQDVVVGSILGFSISYIVYRQYYPPLDSDNCYQPYSKQLSRIQSKQELNEVLTSNPVKLM